MKNIWKIFKRDLKRIIANYAAAIIVIGLCIIPSLYAWINIKACWDPYANTGNLPIAVINNDEGTLYNNARINVGEEIVKELENNKSIKWDIVDEWQGNNDLNSGKYYALIEIPINFSEGLVSLTSSNPNKPSIIYKANEKANAIATKIAAVAEENLAKEIKENFIKTVNKTAFQELNKIGLYLDTNKSKILGLKDVIATACIDLNKIQEHISDTSKDASELSSYLNTVRNDLPKLTKQIKDLQGATESSKEITVSIRDSLLELNGNINTDIIEMNNLNEKIANNLKKLLNDKLTPIDKEKILEDINQSISLITTITNYNIKLITNIENNLVDTNLGGLNNNLNKIVQIINDFQNEVINLQNQINSTTNSDELKELIDKLDKKNQELFKAITDLSDEFYTSSADIINNTTKVIDNTLDNLNSVLQTTENFVPQLNALATLGIATSNEASVDAENISNKIGEIKAQLDQLSDKLSVLNEDNLNTITKLMEKNPDELADFLASPIDVKEVDVYGNGAFGKGLTPFYTVLAIWVGALLSAALLSTECDKLDGVKNLTIIEKHFGKMILFIIISLIQALIVTIGDILIFPLNVANKPLFIGFALLTSLTFTTIIYTLVAIFGNVGKAIAVVIMVFQIAGAGGIYPIQTNPEIFGVLYPLWPFTYAINGFREAIAGPVWKTVNTSIYVLGAYTAIFIFFVVLKKPFYKLTHIMEEKFKEAGV